MRPIRDTDLIDCLALARALQSHGRCRGPMATFPGPNGRPWDADPGDPRATRWCAIGALTGAAYEIGETWTIAEQLLSRTYQLLGLAMTLAEHAEFFTPAALNDHPRTPKKQVLALYDRAAGLIGK